MCGKSSTWSQFGLFFAATVLALPAYVTRHAVAQEGKLEILLTTSPQGPDGAKIFRINADGSGRKLLTAWKKGIREAYPVLSPDGKRIAFVGNPDDGKDFGLYVMNADGSGRSRLAANAKLDMPDLIRAPSWSPDGKRIAFCTAGFGLKNESRKPRLYLVDADGQNLKRLEKADGMHPAWSSDGKRLLFAREEHEENRIVGPTLCVVDRDGTNVRPLVKNAAMGAWSPDGKALAYVVLENNYVRGDVTGLFVARADGSEPKRIAGGPAEVTSGVQWSADGKRLFFSRGSYKVGAEPAFAIHVIDIDGRNLRRVTDGKEPEHLGVGGRP